MCVCDCRVQRVLGNSARRAAKLRRIVALMQMHPSRCPALARTLSHKQCTFALHFHAQHTHASSHRHTHAHSRKSNGNDDDCTTRCLAHHTHTSLALFHHPKISNLILIRNLLIKVTPAFFFFPFARFFLSLRFALLREYLRFTFLA